MVSKERRKRLKEKKTTESRAEKRSADKKKYFEENKNEVKAKVTNRFKNDDKASLLNKKNTCKRIKTKYATDDSFREHCIDSALKRDRNQVQH